MSDDTETYLDQFDSVHRLAFRISEAGKRFSDIAGALQRKPNEAYATIKDDWPSKEEVARLLQELVGENAKLEMLWGKLPERTRQSMPRKSPAEATKLGTLIPD